MLALLSKFPCRIGLCRFWPVRPDAGLTCPKGATMHQPVGSQAMSKLPMTAAGHSVLEDELNQRTRIERARLVQRIQDAIADDSNLAENSEYQAAKTEQEVNEARIAELEDKLARSEVIDVSKLSGNTIKF